jgi:excisionase family DNA binding protein
MTEQRNAGLADVARKWLTTKQVAEYLGVKDQTLRVWRHQGRGPLFHLIGRLVRYHIDELDDFVRGGPFGVQHSAPKQAAK